MTTARSSATARSAQSLGRRGEDAAARYLEASGMVVLSRNWRCRDGELDLVATDGALLVVAEVKTRSGRGYGDPAEAITAVKAGRIRRVSMAWLRAHQVGWCDIRFDVLSVLCPPGGEPTIDHLVGAF